MATSAMPIKVALATLAAALVAAPEQAEAAISCGMVVQMLIPCAGYLISSGAGAVPEVCCSGIVSLNSTTQTMPDRQAVCTCLKAAANALPAISMTVAAGVPEKCGVHIPYQISLSTDCSL